jgi:hypothetical protein
MKQSKQQEHRFVGILRQRIPDFPSGRLVETESPDFVIITRNGKVGVEVTKIHQQTASNRLRRQESEQEKIANEAVQIFETKSSIPLEVEIHFSANSVFNKRNRSRLAMAIANLINAYLPSEAGPLVSRNDWSDQEAFPYEVDSISIYRLAGLKQNFWSVPSAGLVQENFVAEMQAVITKKDTLITKYQICSEYWLLIVAEGNSASTFFHPSSPTVEHRYTSAFKRIFFLEAFTRKLWELRITPNCPDPFAAKDSRRYNLAT